MHELSLTLALLDEVDTVVRREGATRVTSVSVRVGRQSAIADVARLGTIASAADLCIEQVEGRAFDLVGLELR
jgi:Zn finger protein HypA/HybF involved in hydrogenase expression